MYLDKEGLKNASIEDILEELKIVDDELFCVERSLPLSKSYALRSYSNRLLKEVITRIENLEIKEEGENMTTSRQVVDDRAFEKNYNIEWCLGSGKIQTTSAVMTCIEDGYIFFRYPSGGIFVVKDDAIRSLQCLE